jgi:hypothetical protein
MAARVIWGPLKYPGMDDHDAGHGNAHGSAAGHEHEEVKDIGAREMGILVPIALAVIVMGFPARIMRSMNSPIQIIRGPVAAMDAKEKTNAVAVDDANVQRSTSNVQLSMERRPLLKVER